ncbi:hypothetical protein [Sporolactobacillus nakayamae]|uniref:Uncharacterized protein n=1 Tax=Sporolactobacillus nakayamae TaxID=269670 RepID=A0A1I2P7L2_9BACL|nr:hypothetical protein [Sporolactobacillus nakayamae]SFG09636.1 hypothetical protein SAMN02982927_00656 [Sporolactobacillus nakayamae]
MLTNTELLLVQLNNKMDRLIELMEGSQPYEPKNELPDFLQMSSVCSAPLIKHSSYECGAAGKDDTNERGRV